MEDFSTKIVNTQAQERVTKVLRTNANKERDKNGKNKKDEKDNKEDVQAIEDQLILSTTRDSEDNVELHEETNEQEENVVDKQDEPDKPAEEDNESSSHVDLKA